MIILCLFCLGTTVFYDTYEWMNQENLLPQNKTFQNLRHRSEYLGNVKLYF
jgi:hypothetical protein